MDGAPRADLSRALSPDLSPLAGELPKAAGKTIRAGSSGVLAYPGHEGYLAILAIAVILALLLMPGLQAP